MQITINDTPYEVPFDLSDITLEKFIGYYEKYGRDLDKHLEETAQRNYEKLLQEKGFSDITDDDIELHRFLDIDTHIDNEAIAWFSFWTDLDLYEVRESPLINPLLAQYRVFRQLLDQSLKESNTLTEEINWNGDVWEIQDYAVNPASDMTFNEIITSKEVMRQVYAIGKGKWDAMPYLCAVFLRKKDEAFDEQFCHEGSERLQVMMQLPMSIAVRVAFFLSICVHTWRSTSLYSTEEEEPEMQSQS